MKPTINEDVTLGDIVLAFTAVLVFILFSPVILAVWIAEKIGSIVVMKR